MHSSDITPLPVHRFYPKRDPDDQVERVVTVVWPPFGYRAELRGDGDPSPN